MTFTFELAIRSSNTCPGPTLGNWSTSPTIIILVFILSPFKRLENKYVSIILASSIKTNSTLLLLYSFI